MACSAKPPDPRLPAEISAPSLDDWRAAAGELAEKIARDVATHGQSASATLSSSATLAPVQGDVPRYFDDLLLASLIDNGVQVTPLAEAGNAELHIECRATPSETAPHPRGLTVEPAQLRSEILIFCRVAREGAYVAAQQRSLPVASRRMTKSIVIEVKE